MTVLFKSEKQPSNAELCDMMAEIDRDKNGTIVRKFITRSSMIFFFFSLFFLFFLDFFDTFIVYFFIFFASKW